MTERTHKLLSERYVPKWLKLILIPTLSLDETDLVISENKNAPAASILASKKGYERAACFTRIDPNITHFVTLGCNKEKLRRKDWKPITLRKILKNDFTKNCFLRNKIPIYFVKCLNR